jgi:hypothetical protein
MCICSLPESNLRKISLCTLLPAEAVLNEMPSSAGYHIHN